MLSSLRNLRGRKALGKRLTDRFFRTSSSSRDTWLPWDDNGDGKKVANPSSLGFPDFIDEWSPRRYKQVLGALSLSSGLYIGTAIATETVSLLGAGLVSFTALYGESQERRRKAKWLAGKWKSGGSGQGKSEGAQGEIGEKRREKRE